jgi:hypothetical protein
VWWKPVATQFDQGLLVAVGVDPTMQAHAPGETCWHSLRNSTFDEITEESTGHQIGIAFADGLATHAGRGCSLSADQAVSEEVHLKAR